MERLEGRTLREEMRERGNVLPIRDAIGTVVQVLAGLAAAHRIGIIHRDVKADNVFVCAAPAGGAQLVKLLDFGVAKIVDRGEGRVPALAYPTEEGTLVGSPRTISPEQARCQKVDARADVYAAGILLYTLIVGDGPFDYAKDMVEFLKAHIEDPPTPPSIAASQHVPPELNAAILKALAKLPEHRFQTADAFAEELGRIESALAATPELHARVAPAVEGWRPPAALGGDPGETAALVQPTRSTPLALASSGVSSGVSAADAVTRAAPARGGVRLAPPLPRAAPALVGRRRSTVRDFLVLLALSVAAFGLASLALFRWWGGP
jgi:serine/threonine-protein kinase